VHVLAGDRLRVGAGAFECDIQDLADRVETIASTWDAIRLDADAEN
jgi:hypothetical protein